MVYYQMTGGLWCYDITISKQANTSISVDHLISIFTSLCKRWGFQHEVGTKTNFEHYQCRVSLKVRKDKKCLWKLLLNKGIQVNEDSLSQTSQSNTKGEEFYSYTTKEDTRVNGPWTDRDIAKYIPTQYQGKLKSLRPWQEKVIESMGIHDERKINWIYDEAGNNGKSTIAHLCRLHYSGVVLPIVNDAEKLIQSLCNILTSKNIRKRIPIFIDLPRSMEKNKLYGFISAIEFIMSGYVYDVRNNYKDWDFDTPCIWVFSNTMPDYSTLTGDRWNLWGIENQDLVEL